MQLRWLNYHGASLQKPWEGLLAPGRRDIEDDSTSPIPNRNGAAQALQQCSETSANMRRCRVALFLLLGYALIVEWLVYLVAPYWNWPHLPLTAGIGTRLLLVADPQLLGRVNTAPGLFGIIERWDADRYISKTFALANDYFKPHVVIFLGDLSDEGEFATDDDFRSYVERFFNIFTHIDYRQVQYE
ncbi:metallophosphoesterase 1 homolog [Dermacentor silvarum]|uniref:metallophosphoesterase 1 homolog n=1 Tax=Dermacentor silvarum TaxID=543639 RepID=UPI00189B7A2F|nr:metallophosphoesterase 1 homolog [Dermacentor silvarum]